MATESNPPNPRPSSSSFILFPILGLLAVGNLIFAFLWLYPTAAGPESERGGRRIQAVAGERVVRLDEGSSGPAKLYEATLPTEAFDKLAKDIADLATPLPGDMAKEFFESEVGKAAKPACTITFPTRKGTETLEAYVLDVRRQVCYCRIGTAREPIAIKASKFQKITAPIAEEVDNVAGSLPLPYYVPITDVLAPTLAKLATPLHVTTVSVNPVNYVQDVLNPKSATVANAIRFAMPDSTTILAMFGLSEELAMARGLAESMARACPKVEARHLDFATQAAALRDFARMVKRPLDELSDSLVLQYGDRVRVIHSSDLMTRAEETAVGPPRSAPHFEGEKVVAKAIEDLAAQRGLVYFAEGFGERRTTDRTRPGYRLAAEQIDARGFQTATVDLTAAKELPADCKLLVLAGPKKPYPEGVTAMLTKFVEGGGRLALLLDPPDGAAVLPDLLKRYGITAGDFAKLVETNDPQVNQPGVVPTVVSRGADFARTWPREILLYTACELGLKPAPPTAPFETVRLGEVKMLAGQGACVMAAVRPRGGAPGPKLLVFGDVDAFCNYIVEQVEPNIAFLLAALAWLAQ